MTGLTINGVTAGYGDVTVLQDVAFDVAAPGITAVIGSNGAGKTTLLRALSGLIKPNAGRIALGGIELAGLAPDAFVATGIAHVPEGRRLFAGMTVEDNLMMGAFSRRLPASVLREELDAVYALFPRLAERRKQDAVSMSGGEQQMCAIGRGLMAKPKVMLIDELSLGLAPVAVDVLVDALTRLAADGLGLLVVEQDVAVAFDLASQIVVLDRGRVTRTGPSASVAADPAVRAAYLGEA
ncbi:MAG: ABC transporter ATP-binding protein [Phreatobacter sp.]|uniref:ABC transporter ATP-binding protein n=1 Tax=Phreatobacter sp. TaxID=1966341 RepID=UPI001A53EAD0|nr:ABC transporter ATP-binding protein [Phreatobacter sp.]MBL8570182.1 ABC transporter ATP-binding protein [Phreatobacter sp.]